MKKAGNELFQFLAGLAMAVVGFYIFSMKVTVRSSFFGGLFSIGGFSFNNGLIMIPFIIGIIWMFAGGANFASKLFTGLSILLIITAVIMSTNISLRTITLYEWILILVLFFGGIGLLAKVLLANPKEDDDDRYIEERHRSKKHRRRKDVDTEDIEDELARIKRGR